MLSDRASIRRRLKSEDLRNPKDLAVLDYGLG
jgi:hypothetical protein